MVIKMTQLHSSTTPEPFRNGDFRRVQEQLRKYALTEANGFTEIMALVRHFSETQLSTPLNDGKCRQKTAVLLGYEKHNLFLKDFKATHALRASIEKLNLEELLFSVEQHYIKNSDMYHFSVRNPSTHFHRQLCDVYLEWTKRLLSNMGPRNIQADAKAMIDYLSQLCGVTPRVQISDTQHFENCAPERWAMEHIRLHGLFLSPRNQGQGLPIPNPTADFKLAICSNATYVHQPDGFTRLGSSSNNNNWRLHIRARDGKILDRYTLQIALNQIYLLWPTLKQCYNVPEQLPEMLSKFLGEEPKMLTILYTVPDNDHPQEPVMLDIFTEVTGFLSGFNAGMWGNVEIEPQPIPVKNGKLPWQEVT